MKMCAARYCKNVVDRIGINCEKACRGIIPACKRGGKLENSRKIRAEQKRNVILPKNGVLPMIYYAKSKDAAGKQQTNKERLQAVADLAFCYGQALGIGEQ